MGRDSFVKCVVRLRMLGSANEEQHEAGLRGFAFAFGEVVGTEEVVRRLGAEE